MGGQRAGHRDPLGLAARELGRGALGRGPRPPTSSSQCRAVSRAADVERRALRGPKATLSSTLEVGEEQRLLGQQARSGARAAAIQAPRPVSSRSSRSTGRCRGAAGRRRGRAALTCPPRWGRGSRPSRRRRRRARRRTPRSWTVASSSKAHEATRPGRAKPITSDGDHDQHQGHGDRGVGVGDPQAGRRTAAGCGWCPRGCRRT